MPRLSYPTICFLGAATLLSGALAWINLDRSLVDPSGSGIPVPPLGELKAKRKALQTAMTVELARQQHIARLAAGVAAGRLPLLQGASTMRHLYQSAPDSVWRGIRARFPGASEEECFCRLMIEQALEAVRADHDQAQAVGKRLQDELDEHLRNGTLQFPEPDRAGR